jgi:Aspartyl protease
MRVRPACRCPALTALSVLTAVACARAPQPAQYISLDLSGAHPTALLAIASNAPVPVIFDSGAGSSILSKDYATRLGLPDRGRVQIGSPGDSAPVTGFQTWLAEARLGDADLHNLDLVAMDLPARLEGVAGVISPRAFFGRLVRFEFAAARVTVVDKTRANLPPGPAAPYGGERGHPLPAMQVDVAGTAVTALLDSGSRYGLQLPFDLSQRLPLRDALVPTAPVRMIGGTHAAYSATIAGLVHVGPLVLTDPQVQFVEGVPIANVGIEVLRQTTLVLDPEGARSWLLLPD